VGRSDAAKLTSTLAAVSLPGQSPRLPFHALVHARSNLRMRAILSQSGTTPGSTLFLRAVLTEYGQPLRTHPSVTTTLTLPDASRSTFALQETGPGVFESSVVATQSGAHRFHVVAEGFAARGQAFSREHLLSAVVGRAPHPSDGGFGGGGSGGGGSGGSDGIKDFLCCLLSEGVLTDRFVKTAEQLGIDLDRLRRCARHLCEKDEPTPIIR
jgi:hypothetical protein